MKPRIVNLDEFFIIGLGIDCTTGDIYSIKALWDKFLPRLHEIPLSLGVCAVCSYIDVEGDYYYMVGCKVDAGIEIPVGMECWKVVPHRYLVSEFCGDPMKMGKKWQGVVKGQLPKAGLEVRPDGPWLEMYPENYHDPKTGKITCDLYTPIGE